MPRSRPLRRHFANLLIGTALLGGGLPVSSLAAAPASAPALTARFDAVLDSKDQVTWLKSMSAEPNHVGSPHDKANAEWMLAQFKSWGWDAKIETYHVLFPRPLEEAIDMGDFHANFNEPPIPGDSTSRFTQPELPGYLAYQGDGDVTAPLVYVNYGTEEDYKQLALMGVSVKGKIVIARYGQVWRGVKPLLAEKHGAVGCIIYSDPADDGYAAESPYPKGPSRPERGIQRGSVMDMMLYPGDPLTPGIGATKDAKRLTRATAGSLMKIPALPISYADAKVLLEAMDGQVVPENWRGALPITYRVSGAKDVHMKVRSDWSLKPVYDVVARITGSTYPDQWVVRGNHHDGWVAGASDPLSGMVPMLDEARAMGALLKTGWRPKRTIVYTSWDGEEPMLLGSTEWAEDHAQELAEKAVLYLNTDGNSRGFLHMSGSSDLSRFMTEVADGVTDPERQVSVATRARDKLLTSALDRDASPASKKEAEHLLQAGSALPIGPAGSGSDFTVFLDHLGIATINLGYGGEAKGSGIYHSAYDTFEHVMRFSDPGMTYGKVLSETVGHAVLAAADADLPLQSPVDFARSFDGMVDKVKKLADDQRVAAEHQAALLGDKAWQVAGDPQLPQGEPVLMTAVPAIDWTGLDKAKAHLDASARAYKMAMAKVDLDDAQKQKLLAIMGRISRTLMAAEGLPNRPWFHNVVEAPGRYIGYGATTLPAITESITEEKWQQLPAMIAMTAGAVDAYASQLDAAIAVTETKSS